MDPVSIIGLVASVVQLATFGAQVVKRGHEIYTSPHGQTAANEGLQSWTVQLESLCKIQQDRVSAAPSRSSLGPLDQKVVDAAFQCQDAAKKLLTALTKLADQRAKSKTFSALKLGVKSIFKNGSTEQLAKNLQNCQQLLDSTVLTRLDERIAAIDANQVESLRKLDLLEVKQNAAEHHIDMRLVSFFQKVDFAADRVILELKSTILKSQEDAENLKRREDFRQRVLDSRAFDGMKSREERVEVAYHGTFRWLLQRKSASKSLLEQPWDCFVSWLQSKNQHAYWISGKAGSGKSTLMKFLFYTRKEEVAKHLCRLLPSAASCQPIVLHHLFWKSSLATQSSLRECLRSLLRQLLSLQPDLTEALFNSHEHPELIWDEERSFQCLNKALSLVCSGGRPVCLFIDGLDECQVKDQPGLLHRLSLLRNIDLLKVCASSRPENSFENHFGAKPHLRLQDLTWNDMSTFIGGKLTASLSTPFDTKLYSREVSDLVDDISKKAEGVFLWAALVLQEVHEELENGADLAAIKCLIDAKDSSLGFLYEQMLAKLGNIKASEALLIFHFQTRHFDYPGIYEHSQQWRNHSKNSRSSQDWSMWNFMMFKITPGELKQLQDACSIWSSPANTTSALLFQASTPFEQPDRFRDLDSLFQRLEKRVNHLLCGLIIATNLDKCKSRGCGEAAANDDRPDAWRSTSSKRLENIKRHYLYCAKTEWIHRSAMDFMSEKIEEQGRGSSCQEEFIRAQQKAWRNELFVEHVCFPPLPNSTLADFRAYGETRPSVQKVMKNIFRAFIRHMKDSENHFDRRFIQDQLMMTRSFVAQVRQANEDMHDRARSFFSFCPRDEAFARGQEIFDSPATSNLERSSLWAVFDNGKGTAQGLDITEPLLLWLDAHLACDENHDRSKFRNMALEMCLNYFDSLLLVVDGWGTGLWTATKVLRRVVLLEQVNANAEVRRKAPLLPLGYLDKKYQMTTSEEYRESSYPENRDWNASGRASGRKRITTMWSVFLARLFCIVMTTSPRGGPLYAPMTGNRRCRGEVALRAHEILNILKDSGADSTSKSFLRLGVANYTVHLVLPCRFMLASIKMTGQLEDCSSINLEEFRSDFDVQHFIIHCPRCGHHADAKSIPRDLQISANNAVHALLSRIVQEQLFHIVQFPEEIDSLLEILDAAPHPIPKECCDCNFTQSTVSSLTQGNRRPKQPFLPRSEPEMIGRLLSFSFVMPQLSKPWLPRRRKSTDDVSMPFTLPHHAIAWADRKICKNYMHYGNAAFSVDDSALAYPSHLKQVLHDILDYLQVMDPNKSEDASRAFFLDVRNHSGMDFSTLNRIPTLAMWKMFLVYRSHGFICYYDFRKNELSTWNSNMKYETHDWTTLMLPRDHLQERIVEGYLRDEPDRGWTYRYGEGMGIASEHAWARFR